MTAFVWEGVDIHGNKTGERSRPRTSTPLRTWSETWGWSLSWSRRSRRLRARKRATAPAPGQICTSSAWNDMQKFSETGELPEPEVILRSQHEGPPYTDPADPRFLNNEWDKVFGFMLGGLLAHYTPAQIASKVRTMAAQVQSMEGTNYMEDAREKMILMASDSTDFDNAPREVREGAASHFTENPDELDALPLDLQLKVKKLIEEEAEREEP